MTILTESVYIESRSIRDTQVASLSNERAETILNKVKSLYFALWQGEGITTTFALVDFYEVSAETIQKVIQRHREELSSDGLKSIRGKDLKDVMDLTFHGISGREIDCVTSSANPSPKGKDAS